jgi:Icc protein
MSTPEALAWSEPCRNLYADFGIDYSTYALGELTDRCLVIPLR